jgi:RimJ/RimL family protein N-acetyltransferase
MAAYAFKSLRVERLVATTEHDNPASIAVMRKIGMAVETNPEPTPRWFQVVGMLFNPALPRRLDTVSI